MERKYVVCSIVFFVSSRRRHTRCALVAGVRTCTLPNSAGGVATIIKKVPNVLVLPVAINNSWKMVQYGTYPLNTFINMSWTILRPIEPQDASIEDVVKEAEDAIRNHIQSLNS